MAGSPSILVATPGRLKDYLGEENVRAKFANMRTLILDEADRMLEQGFLQDVKAILRLLPPKSKGWQGMCFSATVPEAIKSVLNVVLAQGYTHISTVDKNELPTHDRSATTPTILWFCLTNSSVFRNTPSSFPVSNTPSPLSQLWSSKNGKKVAKNLNSLSSGPPQT